jgi:outer membrane protein assembly factor BamB
VGNTVVVGSCNGLVHGVDKATGKARWSYDARLDGGRPEFHGLPLVAGELVIVSSDDRRPDGVGYVYAIDGSSGHVRWKARIGRGSMADTVRLGSRVYTVTLDNQLVALDLATGAQAWAFRGSPPLDGEFLNVLATPAVGPNRVYFGGPDGIVYAVAADSGTLLWKSAIGSRVVTPTVLISDALHFGTRDGRLLKVDPSRGRPAAEMRLAHMPAGPPTAAEGSVLVYSAEGDSFVLNALDASLAASRWSRRGSRGWSSSRPYLWRGSILAGTEAGELVALSIRDGMAIWSRRVDGVIRGIGHDGDVVFVGTQRGVVFAVRAPPVKR